MVAALLTRTALFNYIYIYIYYFYTWWLWHQKQVSQAGISNCIPQYTVGCNYLSLPEIPASGTKSPHLWMNMTYKMTLCFPDINECEVFESICGIGTCINTEGNYSCVCPEGHLLMPDRNCMGESQRGHKTTNYHINIIFSVQCIYSTFYKIIMIF